MKPRMFLASIILAACSPTGETEDADLGDNGDVAEEVVEDEGEPIVIEQCDAETYRPFIGSSVADAALPDDAGVRVFGENDIVTQEYLPRRTNIVYDGRQIIRAVYCG